ncbi:MAG TPA: hypothetical protein VEU07_02560, partial [Candidatus Acidoferrum sp.]|nr:hypothetical protein [Candidatus Acidoferrum sp.]
SATAQSLAQQAQRLQNEVGKFTLGEERAVPRLEPDPMPIPARRAPNTKVVPLSSTKGKPAKTGRTAAYASTGTDDPAGHFEEF